MAVVLVAAVAIGFGAGFRAAAGRAGNLLLGLSPAAVPRAAAPTPTPSASSASAQASLPAPTPTPTPAWPGVTNTGIPVGTKLTLWDNDFTTSRSGQVIDSLDIRGTLIIQNDNVIVRRTKVTADPTENNPIGIRVMDGHRGIVIQDCEIDMGDRPGATGIGYAGFTVQRCNIHGAMKGIQIGDHVTALDNWVHDPYTGGTAHSEDVAIYGTDVPVASVVRHNTLANPLQQTAVVFMKTDQGLINGVTIDDNLLDGGNYTIYAVVGYWDHKTPPTNISITNNVFTRNFVYGTQNCDGTVSWTGNLFTNGAPAN